jgi:hypothetical protein
MQIAEIQPQNDTPFRLHIYQLSAPYYYYEHHPPVSLLDGVCPGFAINIGN